MGKLQTSIAIAGLTAFVAMLSACSRGAPPATGVPITEARKSVTVLATPLYKICAANDTNCLASSQAVKDLATQEVLTELNGVEVTKDGGLFGVIGGIRYFDGKDLYAIFLTQTTKIAETCHACSPQIGIAVYQFHNSWRLFAKNSSVKDFGSFGTLNQGNGVLNVIPVSTEAFIITIPEEYINQGTMSFTHLVRVGPQAQDVNISIQYLDAIKVSESCMGDGREADWFSELQVEAGASPLKLTEIRSYRKVNCSDDTTIAFQKRIKYVFANDKFQPDVAQESP